MISSTRNPSWYPSVVVVISYQLQFNNKLIRTHLVIIASFHWNLKGKYCKSTNCKKKWRKQYGGPCWALGFFLTSYFEQFIHHLMKIPVSKSWFRVKAIKMEAYLKGCETAHCIQTMQDSSSDVVSAEVHYTNLFYIISSS